jgi:hypothetical protein
MNLLKLMALSSAAYCLAVFSFQGMLDYADNSCQGEANLISQAIIAKEKHFIRLSSELIVAKHCN